VIEACEAVCDRLDECGTDLRLFVPGTTALGEEADCFATCDDLDNLESEISQSCKDAITTVFECTESLACNVVEDFDFTRQGRLLATNFDLFGGALLSLLTSVPPVIQNSAFTCDLARPNRNYDYCPVNSDCIRFPFVFGGTSWQICSVSGFDMITMLVEDCETEYIAMAEECRGEPRF
jgi:hypothetical protein